MPRKLFPLATGSGRRRRRRLVLAAAFPVVLAGVVLAAAGGSGEKAPAKASASSAGIVRASSAGTGRSALVSGSQSASFGPNVGTGIYQGVSPAVSSLPAVPVQPSTSITTRDNEELGTRGASSNVE